MKNIFIIFILIALPFNIIAQVTEAEEDLKKLNKDSLEGWKTGGLISLNLTQVSLTNWAAGGQNSMSGAGLLSLFANYKKGKTSWDNTFDFGYGLQKQGEESDWMKTDDKIDITSKYGHRAFKNGYYAALLNFKSQMTNGYNYPNDSVAISTLLAPAYILGAIGIDIKPVEDLSLFIAPVTAKITIVNNEALADSGAFVVVKAVFDDLGNITTHGKKSRSEVGGYIKMQYKKEIMKNVTFQTKLDLFSNYLENPQNIDITWDVLIAMKINKYISANITTNLIYDDDIDITDEDGNVGPRTQFKEVLGIGFSYKF